MIVVKKNHPVCVYIYTYIDYLSTKMFVKMSHWNPPSKSKTLLVPHAKLKYYILVRSQPKNVYVKMTGLNEI